MNPELNNAAAANAADLARPPNPFSRNLWRDLLLAVIFIITGYAAGVFAATVVASVGALVLVLWAYYDLRKVDWTMLGASVVGFAFVIASLALNDPSFVKYKSTFSSGVFALVIVVLMTMGVSATERTMGAFYVLSSRHWRIIDSISLVYTLIRGALNYWVAVSFSDATWLWYSTFVSKGMGFAYGICVVIYINRIKLQERDFEELLPPADKRPAWLQKLVNQMNEKP